jgi:hypothetical protein
MEKFINSFFGKHYVPHNSTVIVTEVTEIDQPKKVQKVDKNNKRSDSIDNSLEFLRHRDEVGNKPTDKTNKGNSNY